MAQGITSNKVSFFKIWKAALLLGAGFWQSDHRVRLDDRCRRWLFVDQTLLPRWRSAVAGLRQLPKQLNSSTPDSWSSIRNCSTSKD